MAPIIPNGIYRITNVTHSKQVLDLYKNEPLGLITANTYYSAKNQQWNVVNINPNTENEIILGSISTPGTYVTAYNENTGSGIGGTGNATVWTVVPAGSNYYLKVRSGKLLRTFESGPNLPIVLDTITDASAQWTITKV